MLVARRRIERRLALPGAKRASCRDAGIHLPLGKDAAPVHRRVGALHQALLGAGGVVAYV